MLGFDGIKICPADGFASVFPEHKYLIVETLRQVGFRCGMTGDGVNDASALKKSDDGIVVQGVTSSSMSKQLKDPRNNLEVLHGIELGCLLGQMTCISYERTSAGALMMTYSKL